MDRLTEIRARWQDIGEWVVVEDLPNSIDTIETKDEHGEWLSSTSFLAFYGGDKETMERARLIATAPADITYLLQRIDELREDVRQ